MKPLLFYVKLFFEVTSNIKMKSVVSAALAGLALGKTTWQDLSNPAFEYTYESWLAEHGAKFPGSRLTFESNLAEIRKWNSEGHSWKKGVNQVCSND